jgi:hypothetical protein
MSTPTMAYSFLTSTIDQVQEELTVAIPNRESDTHSSTTQHQSFSQKLLELEQFKSLYISGTHSLNHCTTVVPNN